MSIPRLELQGAVILTKLYKSCQALVKRLNIKESFFFTDSTVVLDWLAIEPSSLKSFVAHRIVTILETTMLAQWRHIRSADNPADCASRGLLPGELKHHPLWWAGPSWLQNPESDWPLLCSRRNSCPPELKVQQVSLLTNNPSSHLLEWLEHFSSYMKLLRSTVYILRYLSYLKHQVTPKGPPRINELDRAHTTWIRLIQGHHFAKELQALSSQTVPKNLQSLHPFIDENGIIRVGGRLRHSTLPFDAKHPTLLPGDSLFTSLLVDYHHLTHLHMGPTSLQAFLQNKYWIIGARNLIRKRVFNCIVCYKASKKPRQPLMGNLPSLRFKEGNAFDNVGVDFGGPFYIRESHRRKAALGKAYLCLFVCLTTKALHLETVSSCSTDAFLACLQRFIARRGNPTRLISDCGTNFIGAAHKMREVFLWLRSQDTNETIMKYTTPLKIEWIFNPPSSPHFGGIWEAGIKSVKSILFKTIGITPLTFEELSTMFCRIEGILNSRPLCPLESHSEDLACLTPGHFLIGRPILSNPERDITEEKIGPLQRWRIINQKSQHFWKRWRHEYLHHLQQRRKWTQPHKNLQPNDMVIVKDPNVPLRVWPLARVVATHPGTDGVVRVVTIRTSAGIYKRPVVKLVPLDPVNEKKC